MKNQSVSHDTLLRLCEEIWEQKKIIYSDLELALLAYIPSAIKRFNETNDIDVEDLNSIQSFKTSKLTKAKFLHARLVKEWKKTVFKSLKLKVKKLLNFDLSRYNIPDDKTVITWQEYYKIPELDDKPFINEIRRRGYIVKEPGDRYLEMTAGIQNIFKGTVNYSKSVKKVAKDISDKLDLNSELEIYWYQLIKEALWVPRVLCRVLDAVCLNAPYIKKVAKKSKKTIVLHRHLGHLSLVLISRMLENMSEKDRPEIKQFIYMHGAVASEYPLTILYKLADAVIPKTFVAHKDMRNWERLNKENLTEHVGDPRAVIFRESRKNGRNLNYVIIGLSGTGFWSGLDKWEQDDLKELISAINLIEKSGKTVKIKTKLGQPSKKVLVNFNEDRRKLLTTLWEKITTEELDWCIQNAAFSFIIGSKQKSRISALIEDFLQANVPSSILLIGAKKDNVQDLFKNFQDEYNEILYTVKDLRNILGVYDKEEIVSIFAKNSEKLATKRIGKTSPEVKFLQLIENYK